MTLTLDDFPNPLDPDNVELCGRGRESFICDPHEFLLPSVADSIDDIIYNATQSNLVWCPYIVSNEEGSEPQLIRNTEDQTRSNYNGLQIGVAIIDSFRSWPHQRLRGDHDIPRKCQMYAKSIHDQWGVGDAGCNNAVMIFISIYDRRLYISTGSGIKDIISDDFIQEFLIPEHVRPLMKEQKYGEAVQFIVESIIDILANSDNLKEHALYQQYQSFVDSGYFMGISYELWFYGVLIVGGLGYLGYKFHSERDYRQCEARLAALHAQREARRFNQSSCAICLEDFPASHLSVGDDGWRETALLVCGHKFCKECLDSWFAMQRMTHPCPICRHDRDDWSIARDGRHSNNDQNVEGNHEADEKRDDMDDRRDHREEGPDDGPDGDSDIGDNGWNGGGHHKSSTSDAFYNSGTSANHNGMNGFGARRRHVNAGRDRLENDLFQQELAFRMMRMRHYYPRYISRDMADRWSQPDYSGSYTQDRAFQRANPNYRPPASSRSGGRSSWGSSGGGGFSFGGGSSAGGGGGGGGW